MRSETKKGAKVALYDAREEYNRELYEQSVASQPVNPEFMGAYYIVKIGETMKPDSMPIYYNRNSGETTDPLHASDFDTYEDALRWIAENCSIANLDNPVPLGFERPRYPRICYQRVFAEIQDL